MFSFTFCENFWAIFRKFFNELKNKNFTAREIIILFLKQSVILPHGGSVLCCSLCLLLSLACAPFTCFISKHSQITFRWSLSRDIESSSFPGITQCCLMMLENEVVLPPSDALLHGTWVTSTYCMFPAENLMTCCSRTVFIILHSWHEQKMCFTIYFRISTCRWWIIPVSRTSWCTKSPQHKQYRRSFLNTHWWFLVLTLEAMGEHKGSSSKVKPEVILKSSPEGAERIWRQSCLAGHQGKG